jgi:predicted P-loop ATPase
LGVDDTPFVRAAGGLTLIAAVRRARKPGVKFDYMLILEGPQRAGKSSSLRILAGGPENFSDQGIMHLKDEKAQQEQIEGIWIYEIAELVGLRRAEVERVKTFLSRTHDKARPAYGRYRIDQPRRCIFLEQRTTPNISATPAATVGSGRFELEP